MIKKPDCQKCFEDRNKIYQTLLETELKMMKLMEEKKMNEERLLKLEKEYEHLLKPTLGIKKLTDTAIIPQYAHATDSGFDLHTIDTGVLYQGQSAKLRTGIALNIPEGYEVQVRSRSGLAAKFQIQSHLGTIDQSYRGEIQVILFNHSHTPFIFEAGDRIAQAVIVPVIQANIIEVDELDETERGSNGFGSTGLSSNKPI